MAKNDREISAAGTAKKTARKRTVKPRIGAKLRGLLAESFPKLTRLLVLARDWTQRKPLWVRLPLYALVLVGAAIYGFGDAILSLPVIESFRNQVSEYTKDMFAVPLPKATGNAFAIAVAQFEDDDGSVGKSLALALKISGVERLQIERRLRFVDAPNIDAAEAAAHETARVWLEKTGADLLLWGQTIPGEPRGVRLIMSLRNAEQRREVRVAQRHLAFDFLEKNREPFEAAVQAQVLGFLAQFDSSRAVADELRRAIARLETFVQSRAPGPGRAALVFALANARTTLGEQAGEVSSLVEAVNRYGELLKERTRESAPQHWAMLHNSLGSALVSMGKRENQTAKLTDAVKAYRAALQEYAPDRVPLEWAMVQNNLGHALEILGKREGSTERLDEAIAAYRAALTKYTPETAPTEWGMVQNNLGNCLVALGEQGTETGRLKEAIDVFRGALKVRIRAKAPLSWAMTQSNLGNALGVLGEREEGNANLEHAVAAYREALKEYTLERTPLEWAMTQNNLGTALGRLGEREKNSARLEEAVKVFRAALDRRARAKVPLSWAMTQKNLGNTLHALGARESSTTRLEEALVAYRAALEEYTREKAPLDWALTNNNLGDVLMILGERGKNLRRIGDAIQLFEAALDVPELKALPRDRARVQNNLWQASALHAKLNKAAGSDR
jgi:tetratricopeptide (TPR) repeat protein